MTHNIADKGADELGHQQTHLSVRVDNTKDTHFFGARSFSTNHDDNHGIAGLLGDDAAPKLI